MIVKKMYQAEEVEDHSCQWFECDKAIEWYDKEKKFNCLLLYKNDKLIEEIEYDPENKHGFNVFFLEKGKTVDTRHWNLK